jgi:hypothetical protein
MTDINIGAITEALNDKSDRDLRNVDTTSKADAVIDYQEPTATNGYTWYRKYKSGWVEQGGTSATICGTIVTLSIAMADTNYTATSTIVAYTGNSAMGADISRITRTTTTIKLGDAANWNGVSFVWQVSGMAAN